MRLFENFADALDISRRTHTELLGDLEGNPLKSYFVKELNTDDISPFQRYIELK